MAQPGPVAVVTGANRQPGIGFEIAKALARRMPEGTTVVVTARSPEMGEEAAKRLTSEGLNVIFHQLDIADATSVEALRKFVSDRFGGLDVLVNNAGFAFTIQDTSPQGVQARTCVDINYYGTKRMMLSFQPLLRPGGCMIGVSSMAGMLGKNYSTALRDRLTSPSLTLEQLDAIAEEFVAASVDGRQAEAGFLGGGAYAASKTLMTQLHRVVAKDIPSPPGLVAAICPGLCRTYMATGRGTLMSNVLWLASFFVGHSAAGGADTPVWLCCEVAAEERKQYHGKFVRGRRVDSY